MRVFSQAIVFVVSLLFGDSFIHAQVTSEAPLRIRAYVRCGSASLVAVLLCPASGGARRLDGPEKSWTQTQGSSAFKTSSDPSGHWEGSLTMPFGELRFELDLAPDAQGKWSGTLGVPDQKLKGFPLSSVTIDGTTVTFAARGGQGGTFRGTLSADGRSMAGMASSPEGEAPFTLERTGAANLVAPPKSAKISRELEGTWQGTLDVRGGMRVILRTANQPDGTSSGTLVSVDEGNLEIPVAIVEKGSDVQLSSPMTGSSYAGTFNASRSELAGTYTTSQGISAAAYCCDASSSSYPADMGTQ